MSNIYIKVQILILDIFYYRSLLFINLTNYIFLTAELLILQLHKDFVFYNKVYFYLKFKLYQYLTIDQLNQTST